LPFLPGAPLTFEDDYYSFKGYFFSSLKASLRFLLAPPLGVWLALPAGSISFGYFMPGSGFLRPTPVNCF
jgi:hypothetical protein